MNGDNFARILNEWQANGGSMRHGKKTRNATLDDTVNLCENLTSYDATLIIAAISEILGSVAGVEAASGTQAALSNLLKRLKYGVSIPTKSRFTN
jgi:hypothetical protein